MSATVDTRVVEAKFDAKDFEKGVNKTIKKLDELKQSLNLKDGSKSITDFAKKTEEATEKSSSSLKKLEERLTSFAGMVKQQILGGLANEVASVFTRIQSSLTGFIDSLSSQQIRSGMQRYTDILTSVRTLTAAGTDQGAAYESIERLGMYADQTSYYLDELVSTMSKFKTAGASLETAQRMVEGLSNAAASMGVNAQQAQRAYLNMQQAYSKGYMMQNDWISFESLPMVGEKFNQAILDAAVKAGTLVKQKNGTYKTSSKVDKKVRSASGITAQNLGSNLASRWFNKSVMEEVFGNTYYFSDIDPNEVNELKNVENAIKNRVKKDPVLKYEDLMQEELDKRYQERRKTKVEELDKELKEEKITQKEYDEILKEFDKENHMSVFSWEAFRAGQEARSLTDVLNTLKDTISRGWATSFEHIFGKLDEAADFFTKLTESNFATAIYKIGEFRNAVLSIWSGNDDSDNSGRKMLIESLKMIDEIVGDIMVKLQIITEDGEDGEGFKRNAQSLGATLNNVSKKIRDGVAAFKVWLNSPIYKDGPSRIDAFIQALRNLLSVWDVIKAAISAAGSIINGKNIGSVLDMLTNIILPLSSAIAQLSERLVPIINTLAENIKFPISDSLSNLNKVIQNIMQPLNQITGIMADIAAFFAEMALGTIESNIRFFSDLFGGFLELIGMESSQKENGRGVIDGFTKSLQEFGDTLKSGAKAIKEFFDALFGDLRTLFGLTEDTENEGFLSNLTKFFGENESLMNVKNWIDKAVKDIGDWIKNIPNRLSEYAVKIGDFFKSLFFTKKDIVKGVNANGERVINTVEVKTELTLWLEKAVKDVKDWIADIPNKVKKIPSIISSFVSALFYDKKKKETIFKNGRILYKTEMVMKPWVASLTNGVKNFIKNIPTYVQQAIQGAGNFLKTIWTSIFGGGNQNESEATDEVESIIAAPFLNISIDSILTWISDLGSKIWNGILSIFTGTTDPIENQNKLATGVSDAINWIETKANQAWTSVREWFLSLPTKIANFFNGKDTTASGKDPKTEVTNSIGSLAETVGIAISNIPNDVLTFVEDLATNMKPVWDKVTNALMGKDSSRNAKREIEIFKKENREQITGMAEAFTHTGTGSKEHPIVTNFRTFFDRIIKDITKIASGLPTALVQGLNMGTGALNGLVEKVTAWFSKTNDEIKKDQAMSGTAEELAAAIEGNVQDGAETAGKDIEKEGPSPLLTAIIDFGQKLRDFIMVTIPNFLTEGFRLVSENTKWFLDKGTNLFFGKDFDEFIKTDVAEFTTKLKEKIVNLPTEITKGFNFAASLISSLFGTNNDTTAAQKEADKQYQFLKKRRGEIAANAFWDQRHPPFFTALWNNLKEMFSTIGQPILDGINIAIDWLNTKIGDITTFMSDIHLNGGSVIDALNEQMIDKEGKVNPVWESIRKIGLSIKTFMVKTIPNFLKEAIQEISLKVPSILSGIFGGGNDKKTTDEVKKEISDKKKQTQKLLKNEFVDQTEADKLIAKQQQNAPGLLDGVLDLFVSRSYAEDSQKTGEAKKNVKSVGEIFTTLTDSLATIFNGLGSAINNKYVQMTVFILAIGKVLETLSDTLSISDELEAVKSIGFALAFDALAAIIGYITYIATQGTDTQWQRVREIMGWVETIAWVLAGLVGAFEIGGIVKNAQTLKKDSTKLSFLGNGQNNALAAGINGILGLANKLALPFEIAGIGDAVIYTVENALSKVGDVAVNIGNSIGVLVDYLGPTVDTMTELYAKLQSANKFIPEMRTFLQTFLEFFLDEAWTGLTSIQNNPDMVVNDVDAGTTRVITFSKSIAEQNMNLIFAITSVLAEFSMAFKALDSIGGLDDVNKAKEKMKNIITLIGSDEFKGIYTALFDAFSQIRMNQAMWWSDSAMDLNSFSTNMHFVADALSIFGRSIDGIETDTIENLKAIFEFITSFASLVNNNDVIGHEGNVITKTLFGDTSISALGKQLSVFAVHMKSVFRSLKSIKDIVAGDDNLIDTNDYQNYVDSINLMGLFIGQMTSLEKMMAGASSNNGDLQVGTMITIHELRDESEVVEEVVENVNTIKDKLPELGEAVASTVVAMQSYAGFDAITDFQPLLNAAEVVSKIAEALTKDQNQYMTALGKARYLADALFGVEGEPGFLDRMREAMQQFGTTDADTEFAQMLSNIADVINSTSDLKNGEIKITPVLNITDDFKKNATELRQLIGFNPNQAMNFTLDASGLGLQLDNGEKQIIMKDYSGDIREAITEISNLKDRVDTLATNFSNMGVILRSGPLVGSIGPDIDKYLGEVGYIKDRGAIR